MSRPIFLTPTVHRGEYTVTDTQAETVYGVVRRTGDPRRGDDRYEAIGAGPFVHLHLVGFISATAAAIALRTRALEDELSRA